jgi:hypothetical protein
MALHPPTACEGIGGADAETELGRVHRGERDDEGESDRPGSLASLY